MRSDSTGSASSWPSTREHRGAESWSRAICSGRCWAGSRWHSSSCWFHWPWAGSPLLCPMAGRTTRLWWSRARGRAMSPSADVCVRSRMSPVPGSCQTPDPSSRPRRVRTLLTGSRGARRWGSPTLLSRFPPPSHWSLGDGPRAPPPQGRRRPSSVPRPQAWAQ